VSHWILLSRVLAPVVLVLELAVVISVGSSSGESDGDLLEAG